MTVTDCARFLAEDPEAVVAASFSCPWCLTELHHTVLEVGAHDSLAHCTCPACDQGYDVALHAGQVMRLSLAPPASLRIRFGRDGRSSLAA